MILENYTYFFVLIHLLLSKDWLRVGYHRQNPYLAIKMYLNNRIYAARIFCPDLVYPNNLAVILHEMFEPSVYKTLCY